MRALINNRNPNDVIPEDEWLDWFGPNGEHLTTRFDYRLTEGTIQNGEFIEGPQPAAEQNPDAERIAELEAELRRLKHQ